MTDTDKRPRLGPGYQNVSISLMSALYEDVPAQYVNRVGWVIDSQFYHRLRTRSTMPPPKRRVYWQRRRRA